MDDHWVAEIFWPGATEATAEAALRALGEACATLSEAGDVVRLLGGSFVVDDEALICRLQGARSMVERAHALAGLTPDRVLLARGFTPPG